MSKNITLSEKQRAFVDSDDQRLLVGSRQCGKSTCIVKVAKKTGLPVVVPTYRMKDSLKRLDDTIEIRSSKEVTLYSPKTVVVDELQHVDIPTERIYAATLTPTKHIPNNFAEYHFLGTNDNPAAKNIFNRVNNKNIKDGEIFNRITDNCLYAGENYYYVNDNKLEQIPVTDPVKAVAIAEVKGSS